MRSVNRRSFATVLWLGIALIGFATAATLSPSRLLSGLPSKGEQFRDHLVQGITLVRAGLAAAGILGLLAAVFWRPGGDPRPLPRKTRLSRPDYLIAAVLLGASIAMMAPSVGSSFWWDELSTLVRVVKRGPLVIASWSCNANNHVLNSALVWVSISVFGEGEVQVRLPAFLLALATPQAVFWALAGRWGRWGASLAALLVALHNGVTRHGVEARGYAGAILFSFLACAFFADLLQRTSIRGIVLYITCAVLAAGFIATTILVPLAHGLTSLGLYLSQRLAGPRDPLQSPNHLDSVFACLWVGVLFTIFFGLPVPETLAYAVHYARNDHMPLGLPLLGAIAEYLTSTGPVPVAIAMVLLSLGGWAACRRDLPLCLAFLTPALVAAGELCLPGSHSSPRLLCFLIIPTAMGLAAAFQFLSRKNAMTRAALPCILVIWLASAGFLHWRLTTIGNPDLKGLAARLGTVRVALTGPQADMNIYYFKPYYILKSISQLDDSSKLQLSSADYIVQGFIVPSEPDSKILSLGFEYSERLSAWEGVSYVVYQRR